MPGGVGEFVVNVRRSATGVLVAALSLVLVGCGEAIHADGAGDLGSIGQPGYESLAADPLTGETAWTYGVRLCVMDPSRPATITSVGPTTTLGEGFAVLGVFVRSFDPSPANQGIIGVEGFPPAIEDVPDPLVAPKGFVVTSACANGPDDPTTELIVGLGVQGIGGGGWKGIDIAYTAGGRERVLRLDHDLVICGPSTPTHCEAAEPSPAASP